MRPRWLAPNVHVSEWQLVDAEGNILGTVRKGMLLWSWSVVGQKAGGGEHTLAKARKCVERACKSIAA